MNYKRMIEGLARDSVDGHGCTGGRERHIKELIDRWAEKYDKEGDDE